MTMGLSSRFDRFKNKLKKQDGVKQVPGSRSGLTATPQGPRAEVEPSPPAVAEDPSSVPVQSLSRDHQTLPLSLPERLWNQAYDSLQLEEASLVEGYERVLDQLDNDVRDGAALGAVGQHNRQQKMHRLLKAGLEKTEKEAKIWAGAGAAVDFVLSAKNVIDAAVQAVPQAALAWTGVSIALQVSNCETCLVRLKGTLHQIHSSLSSISKQEHGFLSTNSASAVLLRLHLVMTPDQLVITTTGNVYSW